MSFFINPFMPNFPIVSAHIRTLMDVIQWGEQQFLQNGLYFGHGTNNARDEALWLACHALGLPFDISEDEAGHALNSHEKQVIAELYERRMQTGIPAGYLTKEAWFCGLSFYVDERVLIPRSPIAELIENRFEPWIDAARVTNVLDLCAGSGCIGIACAYAFECARVDLAELSHDALEVAEINIQRHGVQDRVKAIQSDVYSGMHGRKYDIIVSNPPYVCAAEMATLPREYRHEPELGLAGGEDGLFVVKPILQKAEEYLNPSGILVVEVGNSEQAVVEHYPQAPFVWLEFEYGGEGVFLLSAEDCREYLSLK